MGSTEKEGNEPPMTQMNTDESNADTRRLRSRFIRIYLCSSVSSVAKSSAFPPFDCATPR
jgi:hypothetical protein